MGSRLPTDIDLIQKKKGPGPGSYRLDVSDVSRSGSFVLSNCINNRFPKIHPEARSV